MKKFFKYLLATLTGTFLGLIIFALVLAAIIGGIIANSQKNIEVKENSVLVINLTEQIAEKTLINPFDKIIPSTNSNSTLGLSDIISSIKIAKTDANIKGIILNLEMIQAGYSTIQEIREALIDFKKSNKFIYSYSSIYTQKSYLLASVADKVYMQPEGVFEFTGIVAQRLFFKNLLEKVGLEPILFRAGKFKGAAEVFTKEHFSAENKEQLKAFITDVWADYSNAILNTRPSIITNLDSIANNLLLWNPQQAIEYGFVDSTLYVDGLESIIKKSLNLNKDDKIQKIGLNDYVGLVINTQETKEDEEATQLPKLALILAEGTIEMGEGSENSIGATSLCKLLKSAKTDSTVKAIVLRINSGGGSALASDIIWREVVLAAESKPLVVSMGDMAASGGYYIAAPAATIVANSSTLTGSIGVWGLYMKANNLFEKIGISIDTVKTNNYSDFGSITRDMTPTELATINQGIDKTYNTFKMRVSEGRNLSLEQVEGIAQGRIWSGTEALKIGLVDTLGTITTAINIAAEKANLELYDIVKFPESKDMLDEFFDKLEGTQSFEKEISTILGNDIIEYYKLAQSVPKQQGLYLQLPFLFKLD